MVDPFNLWLSGVRECVNLSNCSLKAIFCTPGVQTSSVDKHVDRKSRRKPDGTREPWLRLPSLYLFFPFCTLRGRYPVPEVYHPSIFIRAEVFGTLIAQLLFKFALRSTRSNLALLLSSPFCSFTRLITQFMSLDRK